MNTFDSKFEPLTEAELAAAAGACGAVRADCVCVMPVPASAPALPGAHPKLGKPSARWSYRDADGALLFEVWRFDPAGVRKIFLPLSLWRDSGALRWLWKSVPPSRPLYGLDRLAANSDASVVVCEGEKAADAAVRIFPKSACITSPGGCDAEEKANFESLAGRRVLIWPDADEVGAKYAGDVAAILRDQGCDVSIVDVVALASINPNGGQREPVKGRDAADAVEEWPDMAALRKAAHGLAKPYEGGPQFVSWGSFKMDAKGLTTEVTKRRGENTTTETIWVASAFEVIGACRDPQGFGWGKWLRWKDRDGRIHTRHVTDATLQGEPASLCAMLADEGLTINRSQQGPFATYLGGCNVKGRVMLVRRTGWHNIGSHQVFVLPLKPSARQVPSASSWTLRPLAPMRRAERSKIGRTA